MQILKQNMLYAAEMSAYNGCIACKGEKAMGIEIERKYLIRMPDVAKLRQMDGCEVWDIVQTYLTDGEGGATRRVRRVDVLQSADGGAGRTVYYYTYKRHIDRFSQVEEEREIGRAEYESLLADANAALASIRKRRLRIPYMGRLAEVDIYSFWQDRATLEIELVSREQQIAPPDWLDVVREVTGESAYKNRRLAAEVPMEAI